ncbi:unnamed protein product [Cylicostephanus goldi]|uniref:Uncharacterized protein n=1 Tax=Cylicostephanus goldi TaxID=71465 RepID=A0A3P7QM54_CYLGO|nr:unnamed protein product [Cylicostephanus goldi]
MLEMSAPQSAYDQKRLLMWIENYHGHHADHWTAHSQKHP